MRLFFKPTKPNCLRLPTATPDKSASSVWAVANSEGPRLRRYHSSLLRTDCYESASLILLLLIPCDAVAIAIIIQLVEEMEFYESPI